MYYKNTPNELNDQKTKVVKVRDRGLLDTNADLFHI